MITKLKHWIHAIKNYDLLVATHEYLKGEWKKQFENIKLIKKERDGFKKEAELCKEKRRVDKVEEFWINKHPKKNINYVRHETDGTYQVDVRSFCMPDYIYPKFTGSNDTKMRRILIWVIENIKYISDTSEYKTEEYWAYPYQTLKHGKGDCEDGAILIWAIAMANNIPYWRVRLNAGDVREPYGGTVGHAYVSYFREFDDEAIVLDWCYYPSYAKIAERRTHKEERDYYEIWWSTDTKQSYGNKRYMGTMPKEVFEVDRGEV
jgi:hypothetical protein